jgi:penicillin-binding protein 2
MIGSKKPLRYAGAAWRVQFVALMMTLSFGLLGVQFWRLQVLQMDEYREMAEENRVWPKRLKSNRGVIYGAGETVLADNRASTDVVFVPGDCPKERRPEVCARIEGLIGVSSAELMRLIDRNQKEPFTQIPVKTDVSSADRVRVEEHSYALPGVFTVVRPQRRYLHGETAGQLLGYVNEINEGELDANPDKYNMGDLVGRSGLEKVYEDRLRGSDGYMVVTKYASGLPQLRTDKHGAPYIAKRDSRGHLLAEEQGRRQDPASGSALYLTLDIGLQAYCESLLNGQQGVIVVLDAVRGAVLAMASSPGYDPSVFVTRGHNTERKELLGGKKPNRMINRACSENYPPGSVFKVLLAAAALEEGAITPDSTFYCPGHFQINGQGRSWNCWRKGGHGTVSVVDALAFSCDVFFYNVGLRLGVDKISEWCHKIGMGELTGIDLPGEVPGLIPDREWKERLNADKPVWERNWYPGETVNLSIGQGSASTTPLQTAVLMASIINGGYRVRPYFNADLGPELSERLFSDATLATVIKGLRKCVEKGPPAPTGTGHRVYTPGLTVLGKTGSAQIMALKFHKQFAREEDIPFEMRDHAWFVCGVMDREPSIAICVLIEHGHHGSEAASPVAKQVFDYFYAEKPAEPGQVAQALSPADPEQRVE